MILLLFVRFLQHIPRYFFSQILRLVVASLAYPTSSGLSKSKNPVKLSVVLALGESSSKAIEDGQKPRLLPDKTTQNSAGFKAHLHRLDATLDKHIVAHAWVSRNQSTKTPH